jgi:hypothetical protein
MTKARAYKVVSQEGSPGMKESVREWTLTLPKELPLWELESRWTPNCSESDCKGQNPMAQKKFYPIRKILKRRCLKWACITHLDIWNTSYGQEKGQESNWQFDSRPLKVGNWLDFLVCRWCATYRWKVFDEGYNFVLDLISIGALYTNYGAPKSQESQLWQFRDSHLGVSGQKAIWMWVSWRGTKYTIREKVVVSPQV